jgi:hypothetical protein
VLVQATVDSEGEGKNYEREAITVRRNNGAIVKAITYRVRNPNPDLKTSVEYVGYICYGLRERGVREDYHHRGEATCRDQQSGDRDAGGRTLSIAF